MHIYIYLLFTRPKILQEVSGVGPRAKPGQLSSDGDGETGSLILGISERLVSAMVPSSENQTEKTMQTPTVGKRCPIALQIDYIWIHIDYHIYLLEFLCTIKT